MDEKTVTIYDLHSLEIAERHSKKTPSRLYELAKTYFITSGLTLDLGCGIGRDTAWLASQGFEVQSMDPSEGMLKIARAQNPNFEFTIGSLPNLGIESSLNNIFCCAVLMHIPKSQLSSSIGSLLRALKDSGRIVLSYRGGQGENDGRLFEIYESHDVVELFRKQGGKALLTETDDIWENIIIEKVRD